jgi:hypothetical protein
MPNGNKTKTTAKAPTDHAPKKPKVVRTDDGWKATLHGVTVTVLHSSFDDWELLDALASMREEDPRSVAQLPSILRRALAPGDNTKVMEALRDKKTGRVPVGSGVRFVMDLFGAINPNA